MINFIFIFDEIGDAIVSGIRLLIYLLSTFIYQLIIWLYDIFFRLCNSRILDTAILETITEKVGIILGLVMLFVVIFSLIQLVLEPDKINDKEKGIGNIVKKIVIVIVMLGTSRMAFNALFGIQKIVVNSNIIGKFLLPYEVDNENFGGILSAELFTGFFRLTGAYENKNIYEIIVNSEDLAEIRGCANNIEELKQGISNNGDFSAGYNCINTKITTSDGKEINVIDFNWLLTPLIGLGAAYFLFSYCISVGTRTFQLAFLEIISPMAIISYLSPKKDTMFEKWWKIYFAIYVDVFIRIMIINLAVFLIATILSADGSAIFWESVGKKDSWSDFFISVFMILALLTFAKKAPDLLKELFPSSASKLGLGITSPKKILDNMFGWKEAKSLANNTVGLLGRKTIAGVDAKLHGQNFSDGWKSPKGKFGTWLGKQRETYLPNYNEVYKNRREGSKEVEQINTKWNKGAEIAEKLMKKANANYHSDSTKSKPGSGKAWDKALDGTDIKYYDAIFDNDNFINSKMAVDKESSIEDDLRRGNQQIMSGGEFKWNGKTYGNKFGNVAAFTKLYEAQQKKVEGLKAVHDSMRKQYHEDALVEDYYKFIKNNSINPASPNKDSRTSRGIE